MKNKKQLGIYIHIPFCMQKCVYCDFLSAPADDETKEKYVMSLIKEINISDDSIRDNYQVNTIFFGGGTPSAIAPHFIEQILDNLRKKYDVSPYAEITIECNPGTLNDEKCISYRECGINRISFGLQSANDEELKMLGRIHDMKDFYTSYDLAGKYGFNNINIDIMSAIPGQTIESYQKTLDTVMAFKPSHISSYSLIIEDGTFLKENINKFPALPSEDDERLMYEMTGEIFEKNGYNRYEISNYSKAGYECAHNLKYWNRDEYIGFGIGAASLLGDYRFSNIRSLKDYIAILNGKDCELKAIREENVFMTHEDVMEEFMFLGLRKTAGISIQDFKTKCGKELMDVYKDVVDKNIKAGLLIKNGDSIKLTPYGIDISNTVMSDFMLTDSSDDTI